LQTLNLGSNAAISFDAPSADRASLGRDLIPLVLPDPAADRLASITGDIRGAPEIVIPDISSDIAPAADATSRVTPNTASAIPLPPAVQTGMTGIAALGMAAAFKRVRRALRNRAGKMLQTAG
jgi:hypothetical protein